jgi:hypothetical protein
MAREVRITINDDEVFERMKRMKKELDLSWKEVLHRGLQIDDGSPPPGQGSSAQGGQDYGQAPIEEDFEDRIERHVKERIGASLENALGIDTHEQSSPGRSSYDYEQEVESLENAEDATLVFPFLDDEPGYQVPLRVALEMRAGEVDVEVVTVRQGKSVTDMNSFDRGARHRIAEELATGSSVRLKLGGGVEAYDVTPVLTWSRDSQGDPIVDEVEIEDVLFGE